MIPKRIFRIEEDYNSSSKNCRQSMILKKCGWSNKLSSWTIKMKRR